MRRFSIFSLLISMSFALAAQELSMSESEVKLGKDARKTGSYFGGGFDNQSNQVVAIFHYADDDEGTLFDIYRFDENNAPLEPEIGLTVDQLAGNLSYETTNTDQKKDNSEYDGKNAILVRSNFIGRDIVIEKGTLVHEKELLVKAFSKTNPFHNSRAWMVDRLIFENNDKEKIDMDMMPMGTLVSQGQYNPDVLSKLQTAQQSGPKATSLIGALADQVKTGTSAVKAGLNSAFMQDGGKAVVIGRVVEKVKIGDPVPWNNNRLRVATVDGAAMTAEEKATYVMPFAFQPAQTAAIAGFSKMVALLVPLNSPNTVKEAKKYQMEREDRNRVMVTIINANGEITDTIEYRSAGNNGVYAIQEKDGAIYIPATADADHKRFYNGLVNKPTHFQITKVENGKIAFNKSYSFEEMENKLSVPKGEKAKLKVGQMTWHGNQELKNGDMVFFGNDEDNFYAFQVGPTGDLKSLYMNERYDSKGKIVDTRIITAHNGKMLWMTRETPEGIQDTEVDLTETLSGYNDGFSSGWVTTVTAQPRNVKEIKAVTKVVPIFPAKGELGTQQAIGGKDYLVVGDSGFLMSEDGEMVMIGYDIAKKKKLYAVRLKNQ